MKKKLLIFYFLLFCAVLLGQKSPNNYDYSCYCSGRETPHKIVSYDNNLQLIKLFNVGLSKKDLDSLNIPYTYSQLKLLQIYNLIRFENNKYYSNIPILDEKQTNQLRIQSKQIANNIIPIIDNDIKDLVAYLSTINRSSNTFSIIASYVIDGLLWEKFEKKKLIQSNSYDSAYPWSGYFWVLASRRNFKYGTNTDTDSTITIALTNGGTYRIMESYYKGEDLIKIMLNNMRVSGKVTDERVIKNFGKYNIFNKQGDIIIPVIIENNQNKLYMLSNQIADKICDLIISNVNIDEYVKAYNFKDKEQALIILSHEIMWDLLSLIDEKKLVEKPIILREPSKAEMKDASDLIYIIRKN